MSCGRAKSLQLCSTFFGPVVCSPSDSSVRGIFQASLPEWVAISFSFSRGSSRPRDRMLSPALAGGFFTTSATWEALWLTSYLCFIQSCLFRAPSRCLRLTRAVRRGVYTGVTSAFATSALVCVHPRLY